MTLQEVSKWSNENLAADIAKGGKFVVFTYAISIIAVTYYHRSKVYYIPSDSMPIANGWKYLIISFLLGWWGLPWGPIRTFQSIYTAFVGIDVTNEVIGNNTGTGT